MIRTLAVNCAPIVVCSKDDGKTAAETATDEMVIGAVRALCVFSLSVSQQYHSDLSITALDDGVKQFYQKKGDFWQQKVSKSAEAKVDELLATKSYQLRKQTIHKPCAVMEALVYGAEKVSTTKCRQFQVHMNGARQEATTSSDADHQKAIERLKREIHQVTPVRCTLFDELFQHHERQLLQEIGTNATRPRSIFANELALMKTAAKDKA